jgi:hypothetical protein
MESAGGNSASQSVGSTGDPVSELSELGKLRDSGVITEAEFEVQKQKILDRM